MQKTEISPGIILSSLENHSLTLQQKAEIIDWAETNCYVFNQKDMFNPFEFIPDKFDDCEEEYIIGVMSRPEYFWGICYHFFGVTLAPMQCEILYRMWTHKAVMVIGCRGMSKTWMLAVYCLLRAYILKGRKIVIAASGFRQSKLVVNYIEEIRSKSPFLKMLIPDDAISHGNDLWEIKIGTSSIKAIPLGATGNTVRGLRASEVVAEEFSSMPVEIFQTVIQGFSSVNASPYAAAAFRAKQNIANRLGVASIVADEQSSNIDNQLIISGTAYYTWNHFYKYHEEYKSIIKSRGDKEKLLKIFNGEIPKGFNYKDYCIIRMPIELLPENFMDEGAIGRAKLTTDSATYANEYGAVFSNDSKGFFKRSCIDSSIPVEGQEYYLSNGHTIPAEDAYFEPLIFGKRDKTYVMGVDPAIKDDNFSIVIIELNDFYRKIVYCWTIDGMTHKEKIKQGVTRENNYYAYCARKIRDLCQKFNVVAIALDPLGGGEAVREALTDLDKLEPHERMILPIIDPEKPMDSDSLVGDHIIHLCKTSNTTWIYDANHELRKDIEDKSILFPPFDVVTVADAEFIEETKRIENKIDDNDSKSAILYEVEELKDELSLITVTETASGIQHFDTPETVAKGGKKSRMKKDRYSALLMANKIARDFFPYSSVAKMSRFDIYNSKIKSGEKSTGYLGNQDLANKLSNIHSFI